VQGFIEYGAAVARQHSAKPLTSGAEIAQQDRFRHSSRNPTPQTDQESFSVSAMIVMRGLLAGQNPLSDAMGLHGFALNCIEIPLL